MSLLIFTEEQLKKLRWGDLLDLYYITFGDSFPNATFIGSQEDEKKVIIEALLKRKPYIPDHEGKQL